MSKSTDYGKKSHFNEDLSKEEQAEVAKLVAQTKLSKIERDKKKKGGSNAWKMIGKSNYDIPDN